MKLVEKYTSEFEHYAISLGPLSEETCFLDSVPSKVYAILNKASSMQNLFIPYSW